YTDSLCYRSPLPTSLFTFFLPCSASHRDLHSFPTRRSSDLYLEGFTERSKINVDLEISENFGRLPSDLETAIFRIVQECLTNIRSEEHTSELQSRGHLVCRLLLEKKNNKQNTLHEQNTFHVI